MRFYQLIMPVMVLLSLSFLTGCPQSTDSNIGQVTGTVTFDGTPLANASITFQPDGGSPSYATTDESGKYELTYTRAVNGAEVGTHSVMITTAEESDEGQGVAEKLPAKYHEETVLTMDVKPGPNTIDFDLTSE